MRIIIFFISFLLCVNSYSDSSPTVSGIDATKSVTSLACLDYKPVGVCFWLKCGWKCKVKTSLKVRHYVPDLMVQVYTDTKAPPILESRTILSSLTSLTGAVNNTKKHEGSYTVKKQKAADAYGHPLSSLFSRFGPRIGYICKGSAKSYFPYFTSTLDFIGWRLSIPEFAYPESFKILKNLKSNGDTWGYMYPRNGTVINPDSYKASAIIAQRVGDIVTRTKQPHVYFNLQAKKQEGWWPPGEFKPQDEETGKWQMMLPRLSDTCAVFPNDNDITEDDRSEYGAYVWNLWRPYSCCKRRGQKFLFDVEWQ